MSEALKTAFSQGQLLGFAFQNILRDFQQKVSVVPHTAEYIKTGILPLDKILGGGLTRNRVYLLHGRPGTGKTTLAMQFLLEGARAGECVLYVTLSETKAELEAVAVSHGWDVSGVDIFEHVAQEGDLLSQNQHTMYQPSEFELGATTALILQEIERLKPTRVVVDSLSEIKLLAQSSLRFRRQVLALKQFFIGRQCTLIFLDDKTSAGQEDLQLQSIAHGVFSLEQLSPDFGAERRRLCITKLRGQRYIGGYHDFAIVKGGISVFPRLALAEHAEHGEPSPSRQLKSGVSNVDQLLGGGLDYGSSVLLLGPAGVGKSSLSIQYAVEAARRGERAAIFAFDERLEIMLARSAGLGIELKKYLDDGLITFRSIDPVEMSPGEFADLARREVLRPGKERARVIVIDSLNGYLNAMPEERFLIAQLHELLTYLGHHDVVTFLVVAQHGVLGSSMQTPVDTSYLADSVVLFRYFEDSGEVRQAISVVKKRSGPHERSIREFKMDQSGIHVGAPLIDFQGVLTGVPVPKKDLDRTRLNDQ